MGSDGAKWFVVGIVVVLAAAWILTILSPDTKSPPAFIKHQRELQEGILTQ